jgi:hypothetical protein
VIGITAGSIMVKSSRLARGWQKEFTANGGAGKQVSQKVQGWLVRFRSAFLTPTPSLQSAVASLPAGKIQNIR